VEAMSRFEAPGRHPSSGTRGELSQLESDVNGFDADGDRESLTKIAQKLDLDL